MADNTITIKNKMKTITLSLLNKDYTRYLIFGGLNTGLTFIIFSGLILLGLHYLLANSLAWIVGIIVSFIFNSRFVFKKSYNHKRFLKFISSNIFSFCLSNFILFLLIDIFLLHPILSSVIAIPFVVVINYSILKLFIFNK